jgi:multidrug efflux pump
MIVGGIIFSLVLTLYVIPAMYTFLSRRGRNAHHDEEEMEDDAEAQIASAHA